MEFRCSIQEQKCLSHSALECLSLIIYGEKIANKTSVAWSIIKLVFFFVLYCSHLINTSKRALFCVRIVVTCECMLSAHCNLVFNLTLLLRCFVISQIFRDIVRIETLDWEGQIAKKEEYLTQYTIYEYFWIMRKLCCIDKVINDGQLVSSSYRPSFISEHIILLV